MVKEGLVEVRYPELEKSCFTLTSELQVKREVLTAKVNEVLDGITRLKGEEDTLRTYSVHRGAGHIDLVMDRETKEPGWAFRVHFVSGEQSHKFGSLLALTIRMLLKPLLYPSETRVLWETGRVARGTQPPLSYVDIQIWP